MDRSDFAAIVRERAAGWRRVAFLITGDWSRADDLLQQALMRMYGRWHAIEPHAVDAYARTVLTRLAIDEARRPYRRSEVSADVVPERAATHPNADDVIDVRAALMQVPPRQRAALVLRFYHQLSVEETAQALGVTQGTVKSQTARGLDNLRAALGRDPISQTAGSADRSPVDTGDRSELSAVFAIR